LASGPEKSTPRRIKTALPSGGLSGGLSGNMARKGGYDADHVSSCLVAVFPGVLIWIGFTGPQDPLPLFMVLYTFFG